jgi:hypothetical protein
MTWHLYFIPIVGTGSRSDPRRPKYSTDATEFAMVDYGFNGSTLVAANLSDADDVTLSSFGDVTKIPDNLNATIGGALATVQAALEARNIPADWITSGMTYRNMLRIIRGTFTFMQRYVGITGSTAAFFGGAVTLESTLGSLSLQIRTNVSGTLISLGVDTSVFTGSMTVRQGLKAVADQLPLGFTLGGITV